VKVAEAKLRRLSQQFLGTQMVATPSSIIISQAMGPNKFPMLNRHLITEPIIEVIKYSSKFGLYLSFSGATWR
jgi:hypothetical protein